MADKNFTMGRRTFVKGSLAASAIATLAACSNGGTAPAAGSGGEAPSGENMISYFLTNPVCIEPYNLQENQGTSVGMQLFDSLTDYDFKKGELFCDAAESFEVNEDATEFTFKLREGATFHNGDPVDAASFKRGWERICNPNTREGDPSVIAYHLGMVKGYTEMQEGGATELEGVEVVDDLTLKVTLTEAYADFPFVCAHPALAPVPQAALDDPEAFFLAPIGNGPFMMDGEWVADQYISIKRYDDYYGEPAKLDSVYFNIQKDDETAYREFEAGNIDVVTIPTSRISEAISNFGESEDGYTMTPGHQCVLGEQTSTYYLCVNVQDETLKDPELRKAISMAINRQAICDTLFEGIRSPADNIVPPGIAGYEEGAWEYSRYDVDAAKAILDEKYPADGDGKRSLKLTLSCNSGGGHEDIMASIQADLSAVGIDAEIDTAEWATYLDKLQNGDYQFGRLGWIADYPIMDNFLYPLFYTGNGDNRSQYSNAEVDKGIDEARKIIDDDERIAALQAVNKLIGEDMPAIPVMFYKGNFVGSEHVGELYHDPQGKPNFDTATVA